MSITLRPARKVDSGGWDDVGAKLDMLLGDDCPPEAKRILRSVKKDLAALKEGVEDRIRDIYFENDR